MRSLLLPFDHRQHGFGRKEFVVNAWPREDEKGVINEQKKTEVDEGEVEGNQDTRQARLLIEE